MTVPKRIDVDKITDRELDQITLSEFDWWINYYSTYGHDAVKLEALVKLRKKKLDRIHLTIGWDNR